MVVIYGNTDDLYHNIIMRKYVDPVPNHQKLIWGLTSLFVYGTYRHCWWYSRHLTVNIEGTLQLKEVPTLLQKIV